VISPPPPSNALAHRAAHVVLDPLAELTDGKLVVREQCVRRGTSSRVCVAAIRGPGPLRFRVVVTAGAPGEWTVRARPL
jgi:hypothetical protein